MSTLIPYRRLDTKTWTEKESHAKPEDFHVRVGGHGFLFNEAGEMLFIKFSKRGIFDIPGGGVELGETVPEACKREFIEETGLEVEVGEPLAVAERFFSYDDLPPLHIIRIHYRVRLLGGTLLLNGNGDESAGCEWIDPKDINETNAIPPVIDALRQLSSYKN